jgi:hypothetical protein
MYNERDILGAGAFNAEHTESHFTKIMWCIVENGGNKFNGYKAM